jgi:hypothetical protein
MKPYYILLLVPVIFFAALFVYVTIAGPLPLSISSVVTQKTDSFTSTGEGKVSATPDMAIVTVGVQSSAPTVAQAQDDVNKRMNDISAALKAIGISEADIQTTNYSVQPTYDYTSPNQRITGYTASSNIEIKVRDLDTVNAVIDTATSQGANMVGGLQFDVSDKTKAEQEARQKAVDIAKQNAQAAADAAGFTLGRIVNYSEQIGGNQPPMMYAREASLDSKLATEPTQVETGTQEIIVTVYLSYELL